jgi:hypothetical protein
MEREGGAQRFRCFADLSRGTRTSYVTLQDIDRTGLGSHLIDYRICTRLRGMVGVVESCNFGQ